MATASSATAYLEEESVAQPSLATWYARFADLYQKKLWHQLTVALSEFVAIPELVRAEKGNLLIQFYACFIMEFESKLNPLKLAQIVVVVSRQFAEPQSAYNFLDEVRERISNVKKGGTGRGGGLGAIGVGDTGLAVEEAKIYLKMHLASLKLAMGDVRATKEMVEEGKAALDSLNDLDPAVPAAVHWVAAQYYKGCQEFADFYKSALLYLAYTNIEDMSPATQLALAVDLGLAALLGENVYNFGELLQHPIVGALQGSEAEWLLQILTAFNSGDMDAYDQLCDRYAAQLNAQPALVANHVKLREKVMVLSLLELVFSRPADDRTIPMTIVAERVKLPVEGVELLLMKALSVQLIKGVIDEVAGTVRVEWVQPRVLGLPQVEALKDRLTGWIEKVHTTVLSVESEAPDLLAA